jgi:hypothetical protein
MRTEYSLVDSERIVDNLGNQGTVLELRKIAITGQSLLILGVCS